MKQLCNGCNQRPIYVRTVKGEDVCIFIAKGKESSCPCYVCLVRVMCSVNCDDKYKALGLTALDLFYNQYH